MRNDQRVEAGVSGVTDDRVDQWQTKWFADPYGGVVQRELNIFLEELAAEGRVVESVKIDITHGGERDDDMHHAWVVYRLTS